MKIPVSKATIRIRDCGEEEMERIPYNTYPISYFGNLDFIRGIEGSELDIPDTDKRKIFFPQTTYDYDILILDDEEEEVFSYLLRNGYEEEPMRDKSNTRYVNGGKSGDIFLSPYSSYGKEDKDRGCIIDVFVGRIGAIELSKEDLETLEITNLYATMQPGAITEHRLHQYLPTFIFGRASGRIDYESCEKIAGDLFSRAFKDRREKHPHSMETTNRGDGIFEYKSSFDQFIETVRSEINFLNNYGGRCAKKFGDDKTKRYCWEAVNILISAIEENLKKYL